MPTSKGASKQTKPKMHFATVYTLLKPKQMQQASFLFHDKDKNYLDFQKHMQDRRTKPPTTFLPR